MAGKEIYVGAMLDELLTQMRDTTTMLSHVSDSMRWLEKLYNASDLRNALTYSSANADIFARASSPNTVMHGVGYYTTNSGTEPMNARPNTFFYCYSYGFSGYVYIPTFGFDKVSFEVISSRVANVGEIYVNGVKYPGDLPANQYVTIEVESNGGDYVVVELRGFGISGYFYIGGNIKLIDTVNNFELEVSNRTLNGVLKVNEKISIAANHTFAIFDMVAVSGVSVSAWDSIAYLISNKNDKCRVILTDANGLPLTAPIVSGSDISGIDILDFKVRVLLYRESASAVSPMLESIGYRYLI